MRPDRPLNLAAYETLARPKVPAAVWDYFAGGSEDELTLADNLAAFRRRRLRPRVLAGVAGVDLTTRVLGAPLSFPVMVAPVGHQRLAHPDGELATARAAANAGTLLVASTMANTSLEAIAAASQGPRWFQLYVMKDRGLTRSLVERAGAAGYAAIVITLDTPRLGRRERDLRNAFALPDSLETPNLPRGDGIEHRSAPGSSGVAAHALHAFDGALDWDTLARIAASTSLPLVAKGILTGEDARRAAEAGVRGIVVSNHGGRQLDGVPATLDVLEEIVAHAGPATEVYLDGGIRRGTDVLKAGALGARAVLVGRPVVWGLIADGERGVSDILEILRAEIETAMILAGRRSWSELDRSLVDRG